MNWVTENHKWFISDEDGSVRSLGDQFMIVDEHGLVTMYRKEFGEWGIEFQEYGPISDVIDYAEENFAI